MRSILKHNDLSTCPRCGSPMQVLNKRNRRDYIYRRRKCSSCDYSVSTQEKEATQGKGKPKPENPVERRLHSIIKGMAKAYYRELSLEDQMDFLDRLDDKSEDET